jgi:type IV secretory pathway VirB3-like protein
MCHLVYISSCNFVLSVVVKVLHNHTTTYTERVARFLQVWFTRQRNEILSPLNKTGHFGTYEWAKFKSERKDFI